MFLSLKRFSLPRVFCGILLIVLISSCGNRGSFVILNNVSQDVANQTILVLGNNDINANKVLQKDGTYNLLISEKDKINALTILRDNGMPTTKFTSLGEVFKKDSFISSPLEEHSRYVFALEQEVSNMLSKFDGVTSVNVTISLPVENNNLVATDSSYSSASVLIRYQSGTRLDLYIQRIKRLVANSVPALTPDHVEVVMYPVEEQIK